MEIFTLHQELEKKRGNYFTRLPQSRQAMHDLGHIGNVDPTTL